LLLAGCISLGGKVPDSLISLTAVTELPPGGSIGGRADDALLVLDPETDRRLDVQRVPVRIDDASIAYLKGAMWVEKPARQFRQLLAETIRAKSGRLVLEGGETEAIARHTLSGRLIEMGYDSRSGSVTVTYDAIRTVKGGAVEARRFTGSIPTVEAEAGSVGRALNEAANDVAIQVANWVG
jgi:cholesterol transport system auxiliary component